jgi:hypothetical protein
MTKSEILILVRESGRLDVYVSLHEPCDSCWRSKRIASWGSWREFFHYAQFDSTAIVAVEYENGIPDDGDMADTDR